MVALAIATLRQAQSGLQIDLVGGVRSHDVARRDADLAVRFVRPSAPDLICRKLGEVGFTLYSSKRYLARADTPKRGQGLAGHDRITSTGAPAAIRPFFLGASLDGARIALRCDNPLIQRAAVANGVGIAELACILGDGCPDVIRVWPHEAPARRNAADPARRYTSLGADQGRVGRYQQIVSPSAQYAGRGNR